MTSTNFRKLINLCLDEFNTNETLSQLTYGSGGIKVMSWAARSFANIAGKGLLFRVSGFKHKGYVFIVLDYSDTYTVYLLNLQYDVKKKIEGVYCDELTDTIDSEVEKVEDYDNKVRKHYGWS